MQQIKAIQKKACWAGAETGTVAARYRLRHHVSAPQPLRTSPLE